MNTAIRLFEWERLNIAQVFGTTADNFSGVGDLKKKEDVMEAQDLLRVINELEFILDDIDEISGQLDLTKTENNKMFRAINSIEKSKDILVELFPNIKSLDYDVREDLSAELLES